MTRSPVRYALTLGAVIAVTTFAVAAVFLAIGRIYHLSWAALVLLQIPAALVTAGVVSWFILVTSPMLRDLLATVRSLLRLENLSHPLLMKLSQAAPGTYHHSLQVGTLANRAAKAIGADALLTRIGAYYHDIGKITAPEFFIENQQTDDNPLNQQSPKQAAQIVIGHIDEGLKLARQYRLPPEVVAFIAQHTGTSIVRYFYEQAKQQGESPTEEEYRYPGPKPQTRETAIVMLADSVEAKARLLEAPSRGQLESMVASVMQEKLAERQLDLAGFAPNDLGVIQESFVESLLTMMHRRIAYPTGGGHADDESGR